MIVTDSQKALVLAIIEARDNREPLIRLDLEWAENVARQLAELEAQLAEVRTKAGEIARHCLRSGAPGLSEAVREAIARNIGMRISAALVRPPAKE